MRKSQAPSFRVPKKSDETNVVNIAAASTSHSNGVRTTEQILNLLSGAKYPTDEANNSAPSLDSPVANASADVPERVIKEKVFNICYGKQSKKKHKTWEGDGTLIVGEKTLIVKDEDGKVLGTVPRWKCKEPTEGTRLYVGNKEIELIEEASEVVPQKRKTAEPVEARVVKRPKGLLKSFQVSETDTERLGLPEPSAEYQWNFNNGRTVTAVAVESWLARKLRPHQRRGVSFMYECVMGFKDIGISGAILADEMGLGKTLQCIALIWTLLRQGPYGKPAIQRVLIVTPSSLTGNWAAEFQKWLGSGRLTPYMIDATHKPQDRHPNDRVVIISYEMLQRHQTAVGSDFDLLICDEAHRLKNADTKASQALSELCVSKRILLTGTPMQNDLQEFFALVDFANPNSVGNYSSFRRQFEDHILAARQPEASEEVRLLGEERALELNQLTSVFILRRTQSVLDSYLPGKIEAVVFCRASPVQRSVYNSVVNSLESLTSGLGGAFHLGAIATLRKVSNHPALILREDCDLGTQDANVAATKAVEMAKEEFSNQELTLTEHSGKLMVLVNFLGSLWKSSPRERVVLVSAFTQTLDMLQELCQMQKYPTLRLDGSTPSNQRTGIVSRFNRDSGQFVFLLSAKAGGVGLNLVGASRLVLFDSDWNPATDLQAMGRIWRDGQRRQVYIYRFLTAGTIEEKMFQRQLSKQVLAGGIVDSVSSSSVLLSRDDLKNIFAPCEEVQGCWTHMSLACNCSGTGDIPEPTASKENRACQISVNGVASASSLRMEELMGWEHHGPPISEDALADLKLSECRDVITFMFKTSC